MKWALIYMITTMYGPAASTVLWDTGFRYSSFDECTQQAESLEESSGLKQKALDKLQGGKFLKKYGGRGTAYNQWRCMPSKE